MARSRNTADTQTASGGPVSPFIAGKNAVINGGMDIWQRGTSVAASASTTPYTADRWQLKNNASQAMTVSRQSTSDTTNLPNIQYCARIQRNSGQTGTTVYYFANQFESVNSIPLAGKTVTLSFYARSGADFSAASSLIGVTLYGGTGTDQNIITGAYTGGANITTQNSTLTTTWQRFTMTGTVASTVTEISVYFAATPTGTAGTNDYFEITGVQLELGSSATPFSRAGGTIQGELAACQRYYWRLTPVQNESVYGISIATSTTGASASINNPVPMRVIPTSIDFSTLALLLPAVAFYGASGLTIATNGSSQNVVTVTLSASGLTSGRWYFLTNNGTNVGYLGFSAEL